MREREGNIIRKSNNTTQKTFTVKKAKYIKGRFEKPLQKARIMKYTEKVLCQKNADDL